MVEPVWLVWFWAEMVLVSEHEIKKEAMNGFDQLVWFWAEMVLVSEHEIKKEAMNGFDRPGHYFYSDQEIPST